MKIPLPDQISFATRMRDQAEAFGPKSDADILNGIVLTLTLLRVTEPDFREFMAQRKGQGN